MIKSFFKLFNRRRGVDLSFSKAVPKVSIDGPVILVNDDNLHACIDLASYESEEAFKANFEKENFNSTGLVYHRAEPWKNGKVIVHNENRNIR